jgi:CAAD domains of cyanobacterial aminoacyl-tRNA synthetase
MTTEIGQPHEFDEVKAEIILPEETNGSESVMIYSTPEPDPTQESWQALKDQVLNFLTKLPASTSHFFQQNRRLLLTLGWVMLGFLSLRLLFSALDAIDNIPLIAPTLELVGLLYVGWFIYRYLIRVSDRQELMQVIDHLKSEVIGGKD